MVTVSKIKAGKLMPSRELIVVATHWVANIASDPSTTFRPRQPTREAQSAGGVARASALSESERREISAMGGKAKHKKTTPTPKTTSRGLMGKN